MAFAGFRRLHPPAIRHISQLDFGIARIVQQ
jgi:hypothetical protein